VTGGLLEIGAVARELGVAPSTLRTWETRYRLVVPHRGERGQRLYDSDQIVTLRRVLVQMSRGVRARDAHDVIVAHRPIRTSRAHFEPSAEASLLARRVVDDIVEDPTTRFAFQLRLVASELVNNAFVHGFNGQPIRMEIDLYHEFAELRVEDRGGRFSLKSLRTREQAGRGLDIVDALAEAWSIDTGPRGTKVIVRLPVVAESDP
jgi:DNA-binding transcriptional MerR regulator